MVKNTPKTQNWPKYPLNEVRLTYSLDIPQNRVFRCSRNAKVRILNMALELPSRDESCKNANFCSWVSRGAFQSHVQTSKNTSKMTLWCTFARSGSVVFQIIEKQGFLHFLTPSLLCHFQFDALFQVHFQFFQYLSDF